MTELKNPTWRDGFMAGQNGQPQNDNPHIPDTAGYLDWNDGWEAGTLKQIQREVNHGIA
jgi:hypothetical protein